MDKKYPLLHLYVSVCLLLLVFNLKAQTTLIAPAGAGGFENGTTFAANGWLGPTTPTGTGANANRWVVDNGATAGFGGARCAYVSNSATSPAPYSYGMTAARVTHFWRDITVPAGQPQITLSFNWMGNGESIYDYLRVWLVPTSFTPTVNNSIILTGIAPTGRVQVGATYNLQTSWTTANIALPAAYAGTTFRLVFEWTNDGSGGTNPPAAIDNISLVSQAAVIPANDECAGAIALPVNTSCTYLNYTNAYATGSTAPPVPGCASYSGGDVWFSAVVPANGILTVDTQTGTITDSGMAFYTGTCTGLTLLECDDDDSPNGNMSYITRTGLTPGSTIYIRVWEFGNDNNGSFGICASTLPNCSQTPSAVNASAITYTSATLSWTAASPAPSTGYEYYYTTSATPPTAGTTPNGSVGSGVTSVALSGLSSNVTYYFWVRSVCGTDRSNWIAGSFVTGYCASTSTSTTYFITNFATTAGSTNITNNGSGLSAGGYGNFTAMTVTQSTGASINFSAAFNGSGNTYGFNIYVDWNNDLDFDDAGEMVYTSAGYVGAATGSFAVPVSATAGNHRMRIKADYLNTSPPACGSSTSSETEDYTLNVLVLPCASYVTNLTTGTVTANTAVINWTAASPAPANGYQYYVSTNATAPAMGTTPTGSVGAGTTTVTLGSLAANTTYYVWVRTNCNGTDFGYWVGAVSFYTGYCTATSSATGYYISSFNTTNGILNISNNASGFSTGGYGNFTAMTVSQMAGSSFNFSSLYYDGVSNTYGFNIWVDWNNDMDFNDPGEKVFASGGYATNHTGSVTVPTGTAVGNYRMRIRANYTSTDPAACGSIFNGETEDYTLAVSTPLPCSGNPMSLSVNILTATSVSISWQEAFPIPANGYQYYFSASPTNPTVASTPTGSTGFGILSVIRTGLVAGNTYYFWVRSNCGGALGQGSWVGPLAFSIPTCGVGNSLGTTTLGCHTILSGGLGLSGGDAPPINCSGSSCTTLEANYLQVPAPTSYTVSAIPYTPPYQFNCLKNPVSVNNDDVWSPMVNLPFNFCFYGNTYNRCLISSNGLLTFDTVNNTAGGYSGWSFATNIPSATLYPNSIFGVYHDIDPRVGGEVGWELITLNSGCRALVAAWNNIPMFSGTCNSQIYTGMIVLYENTNVIEVYIKQKPVCGSWNDGNAIAGIQNAAGTNAVVPPGRNGLDANWTATNEAWRFSPSGVSTATVRWYQGSGVAGPIVGTGDTVSVCPSSTTTYTAQVTYDLCGSGKTVIVTDETTVTVNANKTWNGSVSTAWNNPANWTPSGVPTNVNCVLIPNTTRNCVISGSAYSGYAHNLTVQNGGVLRIDPTNNNLTVTDIVNVNTGGTFNIMNSAGLIQVNNVNNTGNINMTRISQPMYRYDYTYWGSPMTQSSNYTLGLLSPATLSDKYYSWTPYIGSSYGAWQQESTATVMQPAKGYIVRAPQTFSTSIAVKAPYTAVFTGTPNNGNITIPVLFGTMAGPTYNDQYNLLANPYPSSISAASFLNNANNANVLDGTIYFWTHNSAPSTSFPDPFYNDFIYNYTGSDYASWNKVGSVGTVAGSGGALPNGYIAAGQAFFTRSLNYPAGNAQFNNSMRAANYSNSQFFRPAAQDAPQVDEDEDFEKHRIWLNLAGENTFSQILVAYAEGATNGWERGYDGIRFNYLATTNLYSVIDEDMLVIQSRALPFQSSDLVPLGYNAMTAGAYTIRMDHMDGLFEGQAVYLEDRLLNSIHDLKQSPYAFSTEAGHFEERFVLRYTNQSILSNTAYAASGIAAYLHQGKLHALANNPIKRIEVFEISGKMVKTYEPSAISKTFEGDFQFAQGVYLARITFEDGETVTQKLLNR